VIAATAIFPPGYSRRSPECANKKARRSRAFLLRVCELTLQRLQQQERQPLQQEQLLR
jgi:hypothetical protein